MFINTINKSRVIVNMSVEEMKEHVKMLSRLIKEAEASMSGSAFMEKESDSLDENSSSFKTSILYSATK